ncbi:hypothetical protein VTI28DRAFT_3020 [Corynascus sepedonium]
MVKMSPLAVMPTKVHCPSHRDAVIMPYIVRLEVTNLPSVGPSGCLPLNRALPSQGELLSRARPGPRSASARLERSMEP